MTFLESDMLRQILENQSDMLRQILGNQSDMLRQILQNQSDMLRQILQSIKPRNAKHQECIEEAEIGSGFLLTREEEEAA